MAMARRVLRNPGSESRACNDRRELARFEINAIGIQSILRNQHVIPPESFSLSIFLN